MSKQPEHNKQNPKQDQTSQPANPNKSQDLRRDEDIRREQADKKR